MCRVGKQLLGAFEWVAMVVRVRRAPLAVHAGAVVAAALAAEVTLRRAAIHALAVRPAPEPLINNAIAALVLEVGAERNAAVAGTSSSASGQPPPQGYRPYCLRLRAPCLHAAQS